jgi:hypothetical protein
MVGTTIIPPGRPLFESPGQLSSPDPPDAARSGKSPPQTFLGIEGIDIFLYKTELRVITFPFVGFEAASSW